MLPSGIVCYHFVFRLHAVSFPWSRVCRRFPPCLPCCCAADRVPSRVVSLVAAALSLAATIAAKSPVAVQSTKQNLVYSRDHTVQEGLDHMVVWNAAMLQSEDVMKAAMASMDRKAPPADFAKL